MSLASNGVQNPEGLKIESKENGFDENGDRDQYNKLLDLGLVEQVAQKLDAIYQEGLVKHEELDDRAFDALKEFECEGACAVLQQFKDSNLSHVQNKSAFLCGVMKTYRQKAIAEGRLQPTPHGHPDEAKIKELLNRTKYNLDVTTGQRKYGGPPPKTVSDKEQPAVGAEVFIGKIPRDMFEDELVPLFEKCGLIWDFRLMMDPMTGQNRGYAFLSFVELSAARKCVEMYDRFEIRNKRELHVTISQPNNRLFVGSIPKTKTKQEILDEFSKHTNGLTDVILYYQVEEKNKGSGLQKNRGFCFLEYETHQAASQARRRLLSGRVKAWNNLIVTVDWADPINSPGDDIMDKVKVLYVKNLASMVSEDLVTQTFAAFGDIEKVKKLKDYAFVHFKNRDEARRAMSELNGLNLEGQCIEICLAKPQDKKLKEKKLERQMQKQMAMSGGFGFGKGQGMMPGMPRFPGHPPSWMNGTGYPYGGPGGYSGGPSNGYGNGGNDQAWNGYSGYAGGYGAPMEQYMNGYGVRSGPSARGGYYNRGSNPGQNSGNNRSGGPKRGYKGGKSRKSQNHNANQQQNNHQSNQQ
ncbi:Oidioi.mRNA.OKI2018_I69.chr1.g3405.t1.cds [Oikopleura dioica]|uniref:Oidioi.mRNA.OKI2018_I69.chr1.g3405.t1.cds n=1 Tax=Oikopleura dioica TaxID=34765 RepID=A0ABN7T0H2_OIKDI|nr:Oidioi.mRNA.OKI2018_I69.chr1.g3405.t1.cds [Oikopleura dioica]